MFPIVGIIRSVFGVSPKSEVHKLSFNAVNATIASFDFRCYSYEIRSDDGDYYVAEGMENTVRATMASFRISKGHTSERIIPCKYISVLGVSGNGLCEIKSVPFDQGICDPDVIDAKALMGKRK